MATPVKMLRLSKEMDSGQILQWFKSSGDRVERGEPLLAVLSEKAEVELEAPATGLLLKVMVQAGEEAPVGAVLAWIGQPGEESGLDSPAQPQPDPAHEKRAPPSAPGGREKQPGVGVRASPAARRLAARYGISLDRVEGTGPSGSITPADVERLAPSRQPGAGSTPAAGSEIAAGDVERTPVVGLRKRMLQRMSRSEAVGVTTVVDVDMGEVRALKTRLSTTYTSAVVRAVALTLPDHPYLNASLEGSDLLLHKRVHIGVAVDAPRGLVVVTVPDAHLKTLQQIDGEIQRLSEEARAGSLPSQPAVAVTFTVTNSGVLGSLWFTPLINPPQSAILGMGKIQDTPAVREDRIVVRPVMYLCLTYDHRIIEGAEAVRFLQAVKRSLEVPEGLTSPPSRKAEK